MTTPSSYLLRAGNRPRPSDWAEPTVAHFRTTAAVAARDYEVFADISEFQPVIDDRYPYRIISFRLDNGWRLDRHAAQNWAWIRDRLRSGRLAMAIGYAVYMPGQNVAITSRMRSLLGASCPARVALQVDLESGHGFAGPGDHSAGANQLAWSLGKYTQAPDLARVLAYANGYDYDACWPGIDRRLKRHVASYGSADPGGYGQQYFGGLDYPSPAGLPRSCPPFGGWVDLNVVRKPLATILDDFGITPSADWFDMASLADLERLLVRHRGRTGSMFVRFADAPKGAAAVYRYEGAGLLLWIPAPEFRAMTAAWDGPPAVVSLSRTSIFYRMPVVAGTVDPRK